MLARHPGQVAAVFLEAATSTAEPAPGYLEGLRALADRDGFVLVFDEMITGMRWAAAGAQSLYGVTPDLSTWGKALGNGFAVSALAGRRELMELGGLRTGAPRVFLLSTTHGAETTGLAAFLAVSEAYEQRDVVAEMEARGDALRAGFDGLGAAARPRGNGVAVGSVVGPGVRDAGPGGESLAGVPRALPPGDDRARSARAVVRHLGGPHR